jgi:iron complex outermembrane receptor protein
MRKRDSVFRDSGGIAVNGARSRHHGIEASVDWQIKDAWRLAANISYARHVYDFDATGRGESFVSGNDIDTAPRWLGSFEMFYEPATRFRFGLQVTGIGSYFLEPSNQHKYAGHVIGNFRVGMRLSEKLMLRLRLNNITDEKIADRADYASRQYRYLPGRGRELFAELRYSR